MLPLDELIPVVTSSPIFWAILLVGIFVVIGAIFGRRVMIDLRKRRFEFVKDEPREKDKLCENCPHIGRALSLMADMAIDTGVTIAYLKNVVLLESQRDIINDSLSVLNEDIIQAYQRLLASKEGNSWADDDVKVFALIVNRYLDSLSRHIEGHFRKLNAVKLEEMAADDAEAKLKPYIAEFRRICSIYYPINKAYVPVGDAMALLSTDHKTALYMKLADILRDIWRDCIDKRIAIDVETKEKRAALQSRIQALYVKPQGAAQ